MKVWKKFDDFLLDGEWHIHTDYTDGDSKIIDLVKKAEEIGLPLIAFTEHIRPKLTYDFNQFLEDIRNAKKKFRKIEILSGVEAKVLPKKGLNYENYFDVVDYVAFAFHKFPKKKGLYLKRLKEAIRNEYTDAWAHPGLFFQKNKICLSKKALVNILDMMEKERVMLEINKKYNLPEVSWMNEGREIGVKMVRGSDIHSVEELKKNS